MHADQVEAAAFRKIAWRLMPLLTIAYVFNLLERNDIAFATPPPIQGVALTPGQFSYASGILLLGCSVFGVPSNLGLYRFGVRRWLGCSMIACGVVALCCVFSRGPLSPYGLRVLLTFADAGFFPGVAFLLSLSFPTYYRARMLAIFLLGVPVSHVIAEPLANELLHLDGIANLSGQQWMFIVLGLPSAFLGFCVLRIVADRPAEAKWLTLDERIVVEDRLASEARHHEVTQFWPALRDTRVLLLALVEFCFYTGSFGIALSVPQIISSAVQSGSTLTIAGEILYSLASIGMLVWARVVDENGRDVSNLSLACAVAAGGVVLCVVGPLFWLSPCWLTVALIGISAARAIFWTIPARFLSGIAAAGALAFIHSIGILGSIAGPCIMAWLQDATGSDFAGLLVMAGFLALSSIVALSVRQSIPRESRHPAADP